MEELFKLISNYGFPIVVAGYLLFRQERKMDELNNMISGREGILDKIIDVKELIIKCIKNKENDRAN